MHTLCSCSPQPSLLTLPPPSHPPPSRLTSQRAGPSSTLHKKPPPRLHPPQGMPHKPAHCTGPAAPPCCRSGCCGCQTTLAGCSRPQWPQWQPGWAWSPGCVGGVYGVCGDWVCRVTTQGVGVALPLCAAPTHTYTAHMAHSQCLCSHWSAVRQCSCCLAFASEH